MNGNERSTARDFDPDTAPDLAADGWPEKFAQATVRQPEGVDHHSALPGRDRALQGRRPGLADAHRRRAARVDRKTRRRLKVRRSADGQDPRREAAQRRGVQAARDKRDEGGGRRACDTIQTMKTSQVTVDGEHGADSPARGRAGRLAVDDHRDRCRVRQPARGALSPGGRL